MKKQTINAIKSLALAAILSVVLACQNLSVNTNGSNTNTVAVNSNMNANSTAPVSENNSNTVTPVSNNNAVSTDTKTDEKLAQRIVGKWEGKDSGGKTIGLDFKADNQVYATGDRENPQPAKYKIIDEKNVEVTTPDTPPQTIKIEVNGDKMTIAFGDEKTELTKVN